MLGKMCNRGFAQKCELPVKHCCDYYTKQFALNMYLEN